MSVGKYSLMFVMLVILSSLAFGYSACDVDSNCYLYHEVLENETTNVSIILTNEFDYVILNDSMSLYYNNTYQYIYAFTQTGEYNFTANVYNGTDLLSSNYELVVIAEGTSYNVFLILGLLLMILFIVLSLITTDFILQMLGFVSCIGLFVLGLTFLSNIAIMGYIIMIGSGLLGAYIGFRGS